MSQLKHNTNSSTFNNLITFENNKYFNQFQNYQLIQENSQNINTTKSQKLTEKTKNLLINEIPFNQIKKEQNNYLYTQEDDEEEDPIFKEYTTINNKRSQSIDELNHINEKINKNLSKIEEMNTNLNNLKTEKKNKQSDIVNLLSNKESIEEIYKNQIYLLINNINDDNLNEKIQSNNIINISLRNDNENSNNNTITNEIDMMNNDEINFKIYLSDIKESDQKKFLEQVINMADDIFQKKDSKINSSITEIINNAYELFINNNSQENNEKNSEIIINNFLTKISLLISNHSYGKYSEPKISLLLKYLLKINSINKKLMSYIKFVNKKYKDKKKELNEILNNLEKKKVSLNEKKNKLEKNIKDYDHKLEFFSKDDAFQIEQKSENNEDDIIFQGMEKLDDKNVGNIIYEKEKLLNYNNEIKENINDKDININKDIIAEVPQNIEIDETYSEENKNTNNNINDNNIENNSFIKNTLTNNNILYLNGNIKNNENNNENNLKDNDSNINNNFNVNNNQENKLTNGNENENQLSHDVIIEYEDGIDQNVEINYEEDDMSNEYNYEKENELINKGINPYNNEINELKSIEDSHFQNLSEEMKSLDLKENSNIKKKIYQKNEVIPVDENEKNSNINDNNIKNTKKNLLIYIKKQNDDKDKDLKNNKLDIINNQINKKDIETEDDIKKKKKMDNLDYIIIENDDNNDIFNSNNNKEKNEKIQNEINNTNNNINISNNYRRNKNNNIQIRENNDKIINSNIRKINDYTFNISINNDNKNIFTEILPKNKSNIQNLKNQNIFINGNNYHNQRNKNISNNVCNNISESKNSNTYFSDKIDSIKSDDNFQLAKKIKYNDYSNNSTNNEEIITYRVSSITKNELQGISKTNTDLSNNNISEKFANIELDNYNRVQRIMNGTPNLDLNLSKKDIENNNKVNNMNMKGRQNYNFISIVNITNNSPLKDEQKDKKLYNNNKDDNIDYENYDDHKIYTKKIKGNFNTKKTSVKKLLKENNDSVDNKFEFKNEKSRNNDINFENNSYKEIFNNSNNLKKVNLSQYLNIKKNNTNDDDINTKIINKEINQINIINNNSNKNINMNDIHSNGGSSNSLNKLSNNKNIKKIAFKKNNNNSLNINKRNNNKKDFFHNTKETTLKITKTREVNLNDIKFSKLSLLSRKNISKTMSSKNSKKGKNKVIYNLNINKNIKNDLFLKKISKSNDIKNQISSSFSLKLGKNKKKLGSFQNHKGILANSLKLIDNRNNSGQGSYKHMNLNDSSLKNFESLNSSQNTSNKDLHYKAYKVKNNKFEKNHFNIKSSQYNNINKNNIYIRNFVSPNNITKYKISSIPLNKAIQNNKSNYNNNTYDINLNKSDFNSSKNNNEIKNNNVSNFSDLNDNNKCNSNPNTIDNINKISYFSEINILQNYDNEFNILTKGTKQIICYYRIFNKDNIKLNILENSSTNFEIFGFSQGYIFLCLKSDILKFSSTKNNKELIIYLKNIIGLEIETYMKNILKIHEIYEQISNEKENDQELTINNLLNINEIIEIPMEKKDKIKAALCNIFSFNLKINGQFEGIIECIFNNFQIYTFLIKYLEKIVEHYKNNDI